MKRTIKKQFWLNQQEDNDLKDKAERTCLTEAALLRLLIRSYHPKEKPDEKFYHAMRELSLIGSNINQLAAKAHSLVFIDAQKLDEEVKRWHQFQSDIEREFLRPEDNRKRWQ